MEGQRWGGLLLALIVQLPAECGSKHPRAQPSEQLCKCTVSLVPRRRPLPTPCGARNPTQLAPPHPTCTQACPLHLHPPPSSSSLLHLRDGGIDAVIDHEAGVLAAARPVDVYATEEPAAAFHARVAFCMDIHNEALKAMRFEGRWGG